MCKLTREYNRTSFPPRRRFSFLASAPPPLRECGTAGEGVKETPVCPQKKHFIIVKYMKRFDHCCGFLRRSLPSQFALRAIRSAREEFVTSLPNLLIIFEMIILYSLARKFPVCRGASDEQIPLRSS